MGAAESSSLEDGSNAESSLEDGSKEASVQTIRRTLSRESKQVNAYLPTWLGGKATADDLAQQHADESSRAAVQSALTLITKGIAGERCGCYRRTIFTNNKHVTVGDEVAVVHVYEVVDGSAWRCSMLSGSTGAKPVLGEYVDGSEWTGIDGWMRV